MRLTVSISDDLCRELRGRARAEGIPLGRVVEECLRAGLAVRKAGTRPANRPRPVFDLGRPVVDLDHALRLAAEMEDEEILRKMEAGK